MKMMSKKFKENLNVNCVVETVVSPLKFCFILFMCEYLSCVYWYPKRPEEDVGLPRARVTSTCGRWEPNGGPLEE